MTGAVQRKGINFSAKLPKLQIKEKSSRAEKTSKSQSYGYFKGI